MIKAVLSLLEKQNESIVNLLNNVIGCLVTKLLTNVVYKKLGVVKNYISSFSSKIEDNIDKTRKKTSMIFASRFDRRKVNLFVYIKFWRQACLPSLLYDV